MLTYSLKKTPGIPLYEALYRAIREDILSGTLKPGEKLPSKRCLAQNLEVSKITVEAAYSQLLSEGFIRSQERQGYFVELVERPAPAALPCPDRQPQTESSPNWNDGGTGRFPFSVWSRLQREVMLDFGERLLLPMPNQGIPELREAIAGHLAAFRGMRVDPGCILVGAGTDFLYNLLIQLLGRELVYAVEEPGYGKIRRVYTAGGVQCVSAPLDSRGVCPQVLEQAQVLHFSPSHHFPTGLVTPMSRRLELLAACRGYLIEDDYDSEFRFDAHPMSAMQTLDPDRVIYMNTFSKTLAPSIRISYMVLPSALMAAFQARLGFYSCTVPSFEQYTLARFISRGYFEKHINRMRKFYRTRRNALLKTLAGCSFAGRLQVLEQDAGLHFLVRVDTKRTDAELVGLCAQAGIPIHALSEYYHDHPENRRTLVVNYAGLDQEELREKLFRLEALAD